MFEDQIDKRQQQRRTEGTSFSETLTISGWTKMGVFVAVAAFVTVVFAVIAIVAG